MESHIRPCRDEDLEGVAQLYRRWEAEGITWGLTAPTSDDLNTPAEAWLCPELYTEPEDAQLAISARKHSHT